jgi:integrase
MPCPTKRKGSANWYFRRTIPADVQRILAKLPRGKRPPNWYKTHVSISLKTADRSLAKSRCPEISARVEQQMQALREGPKPLSPRQLSALSGVLYRWFAQGLEDDPIFTAGDWRNVARLNQQALDGNYGFSDLMIGNDEEKRRYALQERFGAMTDYLLTRKGVVTDDLSRYRLMEMLARDLSKAAQKLAGNAEGDYSPDTYVQRFPDWNALQPKAGLSKTITDLANAWHEAALARGVRSRDAKRTRAKLLAFVQWLGHDDLQRVTRADALRWADARMKAGIKASTINKGDLAAIKAIFKWGAGRDWLPNNPMGGELRIEGRKKRKLRDPFYTNEEAAALLSASREVKPSQRENQKTAAAKRWVPWLCAYSGSRVTEMIQIRKQDLRKEQGTWIIRLTPEAGGIKTNEFRDVPVHQHLIDTGFVDFVHKSENGALFCEVGPDGTTRGSAEGVYRRLRTFVRTVITDRNVQPTHAWRYTFKTRGFEAGIAERTLDAICGHAPRAKGAEYTNVTLATRIEAMKKFPHYEVEQGATFRQLKDRDRTANAI